MPKYLMSKAIGIDLGTTNSAVAVMKPNDTEIVIHGDPTTRRETTPSCVWKDPRSGQVVVGRKAFSRIGAMPKPIRSIKRSMGKSVKVKLTNEDVSPEAVSSWVLKEMKQQIEGDVAAFATDSTQWVVDRAIVTVPAYFDQPQIEATRKAAEMAGLQVLELLHEPTAAACYHCWQTGIQNGVFLVYDFGGGTFDVSVLRCTEGAFEVLGISGNNLLGGDDIDAALAEELQRRLLLEGYAMKLDPKNDPEDSLRFDQLKLLAESVKIALSPASEFVLRDTRMLDKTGASVNIDMMFERYEIEQIMRPIVERTIPYCFDALERAQKRAGITLADVDAIILAGGTTHIPLVREIVRDKFCAVAGAQGVRAKCTEPTYKRVDTIVALGAAIRAAATGGLAIYNPERSVRVSFRGIGATASKQTHIGGQVEALAPNIDLTGGHVRLTISELGYEDEQPLKSGGTFAFTRVPLQTSAENLLTFEIYNRNKVRIATVGRPISQSKDALRPTGGPTGTASSAKSYYLEVSKAGKASRKELIPAMATLPTSADYTFYHPGNADLLRLPLYQNKRKIQEIKVVVPPKLPKGTPISFTIEVDELSGIHVSGKIKSTNTTFEAALEIPAERSAPTASELQAIDQAFQEAMVALPVDKKGLVQEQYKQAKDSYEQSVRRGDQDHAVHDFEEMEELVANSASDAGPLEPPKDFFDKLVKECQELHDLLDHIGQTHKAREIAKAIEAQRLDGEQAFVAGDQILYTDTIVKLNGIRDHLIMLLKQLIDFQDPRTEQEKAADRIGFALEEAGEVEALAKASKRTDILNEITLIKNMLRSTAHEIEKNPIAVQQKASQARTRLEQIRNVLIGTLGQGPSGKLLVSDE